MTSDMSSSFEHYYKYTIIDETSGLEKRKFYYPGGLNNGGKNGLIVEVCPNAGDAWLGVFEFGRYGTSAITGVYSSPDPERICVVAKGNAFFVVANDPAFWESIPAVPVIDVRCIPNDDIIVFANFTNLVAYGRNGLRWRTKRLAWDGLKITNIDENYIYGEFLDIRSDRVENFYVNIQTGKHFGGVEL